MAIWTNQTRYTENVDHPEHVAPGAAPALTA